MGAGIAASVQRQRQYSWPQAAGGAGMMTAFGMLRGDVAVLVHGGHGLVAGGPGDVAGLGAGESGLELEHIASVGNGGIVHAQFQGRLHGIAVGGQAVRRLLIGGLGRIFRGDLRRLLGGGLSRIFRRLLGRIAGVLGLAGIGIRGRAGGVSWAGRRRSVGTSSWPEPSAGQAFFSLICSFYSNYIRGGLWASDCPAALKASTIWSFSAPTNRAT